MHESAEHGYLDGMIKGVSLVRALNTRLNEEGKQDMILQMSGDLELLSLLLQKYELVSEEEYEYLSVRADEEWENSHEPVPASAFAGIFGNIGLSPNRMFDKGMKLSGSLDRERELRIRLLEKLSEECEDELYNEVAMGLDDELFQRLLKKYGIQ